MKLTARRLRPYWRIGIMLLVALGLGLLCDAWRDESVFFGRRLPVVRSVPAP